MEISIILGWLHSPIATGVGGFLSGIFVGAIGSYYADKFTDRRRRKAEDRDVKQALKACEAQMPKLIEEMREDLVKNPVKREFVILQIELCYGGFPDEPLAYFTSERRDEDYRDEKRDVHVHAHLEDKARILENHGFIKDVRRTKVPYYRMTEKFTQLLKN